MAFPTLKTGLCGCSLQTSSLFIGWFSLVVSVISLLAVGVVGINAADYFDQQEELTAKTAKLFVQILTFTVVAVLVIVISFTVMMIIGIYKENSCLILPYVCIKTSLLLLAALGLIQNVLKGHFNPDYVGTILYGVFDGILTFVIYSYYMQLKEGISNGRIFNQQVASDGFSFTGKGGSIA